jgi:hypothetical protein
VEALSELKRREDRQAEIAARKSVIEEQKVALQGRLTNSFRQRRTINAALLLIGGVVISGCIFALLRSSFQPLWIFFLILPLYCLVTMWTVLILRARTQSIKGEIQDIRFEEELLRSEATPEESRAEELLRTHQYQLRRYYDLNLSQSFWVFAVGIFCIFLGFVVISMTVYLIRISPTENWQEKVILGVVGAVGSLMTNYIAAIYLKMHSAISNSLTSFHSALASTHKLFLANLFTSRIDDQEKRWDALGKLALAVAKSPTTDDKAGSSKKPLSKKKTSEDQQEDGAEDT